MMEEKQEALQERTAEQQQESRQEQDVSQQEPQQEPQQEQKRSWQPPPQWMPPPNWQQKSWQPPNPPQQVPPPPAPSKGAFKNFMFATLGGAVGCLLPVLGFFFLIFLCIIAADNTEDDIESRVAVQNVPGFKQKSSNYVAIIPVHGVIMSGQESQGVITPKQFTAMLEKAEKDKSVKAVIISIDSPGGEVNAADEIYRAILKFRQKTNRPVIAMMKSIAASGGYYVAAACNKIVAADMTLTGSIGVIISSYNVSGLLDKIGVKGEVYKSGQMKDMLSPTRPRTPEEQKIVQALVEECYDKFASIVSKSRNIPLEKIKNGPIGDGRVYHGTQALAYGLVDKIGHVEDAVALCEETLNIPKDSLTVKSYNIRIDFMDMLFEGKSVLKDGIKVDFHLPGNKPSVELQAGRLYFLPAGL